MGCTKPIPDASDTARIFRPQGHTTGPCQDQQHLIRQGPQPSRSRMIRRLAPRARHICFLALLPFAFHSRPSSVVSSSGHDEEAKAGPVRETRDRQGPLRKKHQTRGPERPNRNLDRSTPTRRGGPRARDCAPPFRAASSLRHCDGSWQLRTRQNRVENRIRRTL